jgi:S1-C subfamily serine protease
MSLVDILLVVAAAMFAISGYRNGLIVGALSFVGFLGGGFVGMLLVPRIVGDWAPGVGQALVAAGLVIFAASLGQLLAAWAGSRVRGLVTWRPARLLDSSLGALVSVVAVLLIAWFVASALRTAPVPAITREIRESRVINAVDRVMPDASRTLFASFRNLLTANGFPRVFDGLAPERILPVSPPQPAVAQTAGVRAAADSVVRITGDAECRRIVEGSGFVYAPKHVITNAHVVAGVTRPVVEVGGEGRRLPARVVAFDSRRDVAVLYVPDLRAAALRMIPGASRGDQGVVAGFPGGGPYELGPARVREQIAARGPDIYERTTVTREVLSLLAVVRPGNSGGPLLSPRGQVLGVVFAKSLDDDQTGYALTVGEVAPVADQARTAVARVPTGGCTR